MSYRSESERAEERARIVKRFWVLALVVVMVAVVSAVVWAQQGEGGMERHGGGPTMGMGGGGMGGGPAIAISAANEIYVVHGGMIVKYDSDLNVVKQAELPVGERPMRGGGRRSGGDGGRRGPR
jgi:hypothetical protein